MLYGQIRRFVTAYNIDVPFREVRLLIAWITGLPVERLSLEPDLHLSDRQMLRLRRAIRKRAANYPLQYITGSVEFMGINFSITRGVFIPRPETELLVETALHAIEAYGYTTVLDLCCGSGAVGLGIARMSTGTHIALTDLSRAAIRLAKKNSMILRLGQRVRFFTGDLFSALPRPMTFDLIVSNPPYVPHERMKRLQAEVLEEPANALDGGRRGLDVIRKIIEEADGFLNRKGMLIMEHDDTHAGYFRDLYTGEKRPGLRYAKTINDLAGLPRISIFNT